jgi:hypothetical protein
MRRLICAAAMAVALSGIALAQSYSWGGYFNAGPSSGTRQREDHALFDRARADLDRAAAYRYASRPDLKRFDDARRDLFAFASRFDQGRYDTHVLNRAIDRLDSVVTRNSLDPRDRGALSEDLRRMRDYREFRARHRGDFDGFGYRG